MNSECHCEHCGIDITHLLTDEPKGEVYCDDCLNQRWL